MILEVRLWGELAGVLFLDDNTGRIWFEYDHKFLSGKRDISPILMPLGESLNKTYGFMQLPFETFKQLPPTFADSLPDRFGSSVLNAYLKSQGKSINDLNSLEKLSYIGQRGMGALEYFPQIPAGRSDRVIEISEIIELAKQVLEQKKNFKADVSSMDHILQTGTSAGGARAKAVIALNHKTGEVLSGDIMHKNPGFDYYLLKIDIKHHEGDLMDLSEFGKIEYVYYKMAGLSGIDMSPCELIESGGKQHFMTKRFDREGGEKLHMQTLCGLAALDFNSITDNSYEQAFSVIDRLGCDFKDIKEMYRRMVFNVMARNADDHTKNISFLMNKDGKWKLSPAYDISFAYDPSNYWLKQHQMSVNGKRSDITSSDLMAIGELLRIRDRKDIIRQVGEGVSRFRDLAKESKISPSKIKMIDDLLLYRDLKPLIKKGN
jgi:serine/threonine-protein kinase HipA